MVTNQSFMPIDHLVPDNPLGHEGELALRQQLPSHYRWDERNLPLMMRPSISASLARFIEAQPFFFIATASLEGHCDASFRGRNYAQGKPLPVLKIMDAQHLMFPDYAGNGLYNSLGNILTNPHIGMLFVDFEHQRRARVNGIATVTAVDEAVRHIWPQAQAAVVVTVEQAFGNCQARIPQMHMVTGSDQ